MRRPSPSMLVAIAALVAALGGTAIALPGRNSVKSNDLAPNSVKKSDLGSNAVAPGNTNLVKSDTRPGLVQTISAEPGAVDGPSVTVQVPPASLVAINAQAAMRRTGGGPTNLAAVHLHEPTVLPNAPRILGTESNTTEIRYSSPGSGDANGVIAEVRSGWIVLSNVPAGTRTFSLRYSVDAGTGLFEDRHLHVAVIR